MTTNDIDAIRPATHAATEGPWKVLIVHEGWVEDDFSELEPEDEVSIVIVRGTSLPDDEGKMPGTYKSGDVAFEARWVYVDGEGDPDTAATSVYARAQAMVAGLNGAAELAQVNGAFKDAVAELAERYAELTKLRAELADVRNQTHRRDTGHQQNLRANTELANERDALKTALGQIAGLCNCRVASDCPSVIARQALAAEKAEVA